MINLQTDKTAVLSIIDPHVHFFDISQGDYHWLQPQNPPFWPDKQIINRQFNENELTLTKPLSLTGFVHIEAGFDNEQPWREIHWLEQTCTLPFRSVAYIDMLSSPINFSLALSRLMQFNSVVGVRYIFDDDFFRAGDNTQFIDNIRSNLHALVNANLLFELHISFNDAAAVALFNQLLQQVPHLKVIINHAGFPEEKSLPAWLSALKSFSQHTNVAVKCSGFEMGNREYLSQWQSHIIEACLRYFGENRVMLASNFPLTLFKESYSDYWQRTLNVLTILLEKDDNTNIHQRVEKLCQLNSQQWYQLSI